MNPKADIFFDAITLLPEDVVEEAQNFRFRRKSSPWKKVGSLAACLCLIASLSLLILPRGCGSSGGNSAPPQAADSCAPADTPMDGEVSGEPMPEPEEPGAPAGEPENGYGQTEEQEFLAVVLEIREDSLLVESGDEQLIVPTTGLTLPELAEGDSVRVTHRGPVLTTSPAEIVGPVSIEKLENNG